MIFKISNLIYRLWRNRNRLVKFKQLLSPSAGSRRLFHILESVYCAWATLVTLGLLRCSWSRAIGWPG